jgi:ankyrin repeat protein
VKLRQLIRRGYDSNKHSLSRCKIIHVAAKLGLVSPVELPLEAGAEIDAEARNSFMALGFAIMYHREDVATMLIRRGARTTAIEGSCCILCWAALWRCSRVVKLLLDHGSVTYDDTIKALVVAVAFGRLETSGVLLDYGLNIGIREAWESGFGAWTILMIAYEGDDDIRSPSLQAARNDWLKLVRFLLER